MRIRSIHCIIAALILLTVAVIACDKPAPQTPTTPVAKNTEPASGKPAPPITEPAATVSTAETPVHTGAPITGGMDVVYRLYLDEKKPTEFVELNQFKTVCAEPIGDLLGSGTLTLNPTLPDEKKIPVERVVYIEFNFMGLTQPEIKGVGSLNQPIGYRENKVVLKDPDETLEKVIIVLCRDLQANLADGTPWTYKLEKDAASKFFKIERVAR